MSVPARSKYQGEFRRLLLAFDIGTTFSGISYSILDPGQVPEIRPVTRFPDQERAGGDAKIPTVIYYDSNGNPCATGAETLKDGIEADAEDNNWTKAYWFKLHLRPRTRLIDIHPIPPLPPNKTVLDVFTDYMRYLLRCAKMYIAETHGVETWESLGGDILYVLTHPNGWGGHQQAQMRQAAILAGFVLDTDEGRSRISFVTEGEASLHFCLSNGLFIEGKDRSPGVLIVDAGGGTIDVTAYRKFDDSSFEEIAIPKCYFQGAIFVTMRAEKHFDDLLSGTRFHQDVATLATRFDRNTKHVFRRDDEPLHIQFASYRERDQDLNIRGGRITLQGCVVGKFFEPAVTCIVDAIKMQASTSHFPIKSVFLVGGFSASSWIHQKVKEAIEPLGIAVSRPESLVNKAVSNGAVSFYLDAAVKSRIARLTYGTSCYTTYDPTRESHKQRAHLVQKHMVSGKQVLYGSFVCILKKNTRVQALQEFRRSFSRVQNPQEKFGFHSSRICAYTGSSDTPEWIDDEPEEYPRACKVIADTSLVQKRMRYRGDGTCYYKIAFDIILLFGLTELKAQIAYIEDGIEKRGPAQVIYEI